MRSILDYCGSVYNPDTKKNIQLIENIQGRATRIVPQLKGLNEPRQANLCLRAFRHDKL